MAQDKGLGPSLGSSWGHLGPYWGQFGAILRQSCSYAGAIFVRPHRGFDMFVFKGFEILSKLLSCFFSVKVYFCATSSRIWHLGGCLVAILGSKLASRWHQDGPKMAPRCPNTATEVPKTAARGPRMASEWPQDAPTGSMIVPRWPQEAPRWLQEVIRWPRQASRWSQEAPTATAAARASPLLWGIDLHLHADADVYENMCSECGRVYV